MSAGEAAWWWASCVQFPAALDDRRAIQTLCSTGLARSRRQSLWGVSAISGNFVSLPRQSSSSRSSCRWERIAVSIVFLWSLDL